MTDPQPMDPQEPAHDGEPPDGQPPAEDAAASRSREWLSQLEAMIQNVAREAAPVAREVGAKAAELVAVAAVKAGPIAHKAAEATTEYGQRFAEKAQSVAADWRHANEPGAGGETPRTDGEGEPPTDGPGAADG